MPEQIRFKIKKPAWFAQTGL